LQLEQSWLAFLPSFPLRCGRSLARSLFASCPDARVLCIRIYVPLSVGVIPQPTASPSGPRKIQPKKKKKKKNPESRRAAGGEKREKKKKKKKKKIKNKKKTKKKKKKNVL